MPRKKRRKPASRRKEAEIKSRVPIIVKDSIKELADERDVPESQIIRESLWANPVVREKIEEKRSESETARTKDEDDESHSVDGDGYNCPRPSHLWHKTRDGFHALAFLAVANSYLAIKILHLAI